MRTITIEKTLYTYDELSESAKERAREEYSRFVWEDGSIQERMQEIADGILEDAGMTPAEGLTYSLYNQGGYPKFGTSGTIEHDGQAYNFTPNADYVGGYMLEGQDGEGPDSIAAYHALRDRLYSLSQQMYAAMIAEDEYQSADEQLSEISEANGWEYDHLGNLA
jgi:hypothetical protein